MDIHKTIQNVAIANFDDAKVNTEISELQVAITANQDLHGYANPWAPGTGKNILDQTIFNQYSEDTLIYIPFSVDNGTYTMSSTDFPAVDTITNVYFLAGNVTEGASSQTNGVYTGKAVTINVTDAYFTVAYRSSGTPNNHNPKDYHFQIESGSSATPYVPYSNVCPITGHNAMTITNTDGNGQENSVVIALGETVYGGILDVTSGALEITSKILIFDGTENWYKGDETTYLLKFDTKCVSYWNNPGLPFASNWLKGYNGDIAFYGSDYYFAYGISNTLIYIGAPSCKTVDDFKTLLQSNPLHLCLQLKESINIQLAPVQMYALATNSISASTGNILKLTYVVNPLLIGRYFMINTGYVLLDAGGADIAETDPQTITGIWQRAVDAINTGKPIWLYNTTYDTDSAYSPIPVFAHFASTTSIVCNAAGFTITIASSNTVTVAADS